MKNELKCKDCLYQWKEPWEEYPCCHWVVKAPDDKPPCEYDEYDYVDDEFDDWEERW